MRNDKLYIVFLTLACLVHVSLHSQNHLSSIHNALRPDSLNSQTIPLFDIGCEGENVTWDYSDADIGDMPDTTAVCLYALGEKYLWDDNGAMTTYRQPGDTLLIIREESPLYEMDFDVPVVRMIFPFFYGSSISAPFSGSGSFEDRLVMSENGVSRITGDAYGTIILPGGDTVRNVLRVHTVLNSDIEVSEMRSGELIGGMQKVTDTYEWYARGYRYPVLKITGNYLVSGDEIVSAEVNAHSMSPGMQKAIEDEDNEELREDDGARSAINYDAQVNGYTATISYDLLEDAHISMALVDSKGIVYWRYEEDMPACEGCQTNVPLSGLLRGQYVIYINVNGEHNDFKFNI